MDDCYLFVDLFDTMACLDATLLANMHLCHINAVVVRNVLVQPTDHNLLADNVDILSHLFLDIHLD